MNLAKICYLSVLLILISFTNVSALRAPYILREMLLRMEGFQEQIYIPHDHVLRNANLKAAFIGPDYVSESFIIDLVAQGNFVIWEPNNMLPDYFTILQEENYDIKDLYYTNVFLHLKKLCTAETDKHLISSIDYMLFVYDYPPIAYKFLNDKKQRQDLTNEQFIRSLGILAALGYTRALEDLVTYYEIGQYVEIDQNYASKLREKIFPLQKSNLFKEKNNIEISQP